MGIALRAGHNKEENKHLLATMEHFLGHLNIPLKYTHTVEGILREEDLGSAEIERAYAFGVEVVKRLHG